MQTRFLSIIFTLFIVLSGQVSVQAKDYQLYYLGGQSNMDGFGYTKELPAGLNSEMPGVMIFHGNPAPDMQAVDGRGIWATLQPGHGTGFASDGKTNTYSDRIGVELSFARRLKELNPNANIAILKYSRGGTSIDAAGAGNFGCWEPDFTAGDGIGKGINQYDHFLAAVRYALAVNDIDHDGEPDRLIPAGIIWMQGESDAGTEEMAKRYEANLKRLMDLIRASFRNSDMPVVIGRISDSGKDEKDGKMWDFGTIIRESQAQFVNKDGRAALVTSTDSYKYSDPWHYDTPGFVDLGKQFAEDVYKLQQK